MIRRIKRERNKMTSIRRGKVKEKGRRGVNKIIEKRRKRDSKKTERIRGIVEEVNHLHIFHTPTHVVCDPSILLCKMIHSS